MATLYTHKESNILKTWGLMAGMAALVIAIGWFLSFYFDNSFILYVGVGVSLLMNVGGYWYSDTIALRMSGAVPADPSRYIDLHRIVENTAITAGLQKPRVYIINDASPNAFATGRNEQHSAIAVTTGLLDILESSELEGVIAHELAHIGNKDMLISTIAVVLAGFLSIVSDIFLRSTFFGGDDEKEGPFVFVGIALVLLSPIAGLLIQMTISRKREFLADATAALITRYPEGLAQALLKIEAHGRAPLTRAHNATAHLYIANPFGAKAVEGIHRMFMTHPPVEARVCALRGLSSK
jgi:heat shock protein HtpX